MKTKSITGVIVPSIAWFVQTVFTLTASAQTTVPYTVVGTGVTDCYNNTTTMVCPALPGDPFYGQFPGVILPAYQNNGNATITDVNTGLIWQRSPDQNGDNDGIIEKADKLTWPQIQARVAVLNSSNWGGYNDWRIPTMKELYSLTYWNGTDPSGYNGSNTSPLTPFLYDAYFQFAWGQVPLERLIDVQYASCNMYNERSWQGYQKLFGMNFADGRIKGYDLVMPGNIDKVFSFIAVRGNTAYGVNDFVDNGDSTITDSSTGLMWSKNDSRTGMNWQSALAWVQTKNLANYCGYSDWRLPNAKELQSIVDYTRSPDSTHSAAIHPVFNCSSIANEAGYVDWPWFWTSTTHRSYNGASYGGVWAVYVCFGRAAGWQRRIGNTYYSYVDVHGAGAQRSSPKSGTFLGDYLGVDSLGHPVYGLGPQGDILRINNYVRLVRSISGAMGVRDSVLMGWNMISNPVTVANDSVRNLFPTSSFDYAYAFDPAMGYVQSQVLVNGKGYWEKFPAATVVTLVGMPRTRDSIGVVAGWNMVGTISGSVDTSTVVSVPPGLRASSWYGYGTAGYVPVAQLVPGRGYWVKVNGGGTFILAGTPLVGAAGTTTGVGRAGD